MASLSRSYTMHEQRATHSESHAAAAPATKPGGITFF
jgi:hypothetical protein